MIMSSKDSVRMQELHPELAVAYLGGVGRVPQEGVIPAVGSRRDARVAGLAG